jgi:hypothetical protein
MRSRRWLFGLAFILVSASSARAQDAGQVGTTIAYPAAIGVIWHVTDNFAVRPDFSFLSGANPSISVLTTSVGISGLIYVGKRDGLRAYLSPRIGYQRDSSSPTDPEAPAPPTTATYVVAGSFGVEYSVQKRFALFGESGIAHSHSSTTLGDVTATLHSWGTRAGVGVIFYF